MTSIDFPAGELKARVKTVLPHVATDVALPVLTNGHLFSDEAGRLWLEATDRFTAVRVELDAGPWEGDRLDVLIPRAVLVDVVRAIKTRARVVVMDVTDTHVSFNVDYGATFTTPRAGDPNFQSRDSKFPKLTPILERASLPNVTPDVVAYAPEHLEKYGKRHMPRNSGVEFALGTGTRPTIVTLSTEPWFKSAMIPRRLVGRSAFYADQDGATDAA